MSKGENMVEREVQRLTTEIATRHGCDRGTFTVCWPKFEQGLPCKCEDEARTILSQPNDEGDAR